MFKRILIVISLVLIPSFARAEVITDRQILFSGYNWTVKSSYEPVGPGPNFFSGSKENVWVDDDGKLHLKITKRDGKWYCAEVFSQESFGYGRYGFYMASRIDRLDKNVVAGLFTWDDTSSAYYNREIDIEFARWGQEAGDNGQYVVQPWQEPENIKTFSIETDDSFTAHFFDWSEEKIFFQSLKNHLVPAESSYIIKSWAYTGGDIPPSGSEKVHINLWLCEGRSPSDDLETEIVIERFEFLPKSR